MNYPNTSTRNTGNGTEISLNQQSSYKELDQLQTHITNHKPQIEVHIYYKKVSTKTWDYIKEVGLDISIVSRRVSTNRVCRSCNTTSSKWVVVVELARQVVTPMELLSRVFRFSFVQIHLSFSFFGLSFLMSYRFFLFCSCCCFLCLQAIKI